MADKLEQALRIQERFNFATENLTEIIHLGEVMLSGNHLSPTERAEIIRINEICKRQFEYVKAETLRELEELQRNE